MYHAIHRQIDLRNVVHIGIGHGYGRFNAIIRPIDACIIRRSIVGRITKADQRTAPIGYEKVPVYGAVIRSAEIRQKKQRFEQVSAVVKPLLQTVFHHAELHAVPLQTHIRRKGNPVSFKICVTQQRVAFHLIAGRCILAKAQPAGNARFIKAFECNNGISITIPGGIQSFCLCKR